MGSRTRFNDRLFSGPSASVSVVFTPFLPSGFELKESEGERKRRERENKSERERKRDSESELGGEGKRV